MFIKKWASDIYILGVISLTRLARLEANMEILDL